MIEFTPIEGMRPDDGGRPAPSPEAQAFLVVLRDVAADYGVREVGGALAVLQRPEPRDLAGYALLQSAQAVGGGLIRLLADDGIPPGRLRAVTDAFGAAAEAIGEGGRAGAAARRVSAGIESIRADVEVGPVTATVLRQVSEDAEFLLSMSEMEGRVPLDSPGWNAATARMQGLVERVGQAAWRVAGAGDAVPAVLRGVVGMTQVVAANAGGPEHGAVQRAAVLALIDAVDVATAGRVPLWDALPDVGAAIWAYAALPSGRGGMGGSTRRAIEVLASDVRALAALLEGRAAGLDGLAGSWGVS